MEKSKRAMMKERSGCLIAVILLNIISIPFLYLYLRIGIASDYTINDWVSSIFIAKIESILDIILYIFGILVIFIPISTIIMFTIYGLRSLRRFPRKTSD